MERLSRLGTWLSETYDAWIITPLSWIILGVFYIFHYPIKLLRMKRIAWVFNGHMIFVALATWLIIGGFSEIQDAQSHRGSGYICVGEDEHEEEVSEACYKRHKLTGSFVLFLVGGTFWVLCAMSVREAKAKADHHEALYKWADARARAYYDALFAATDESDRISLMREIESSEEVRDASEEIVRTACRLRECQLEK